MTGVWVVITQAWLIGCLVLVANRLYQESKFTPKLHWHIFGLAFLAFALFIRLFMPSPSIHWSAGVLYLGIFIMLWVDPYAKWGREQVRSKRRVKHEGQ